MRHGVVILPEHPWPHAAELWRRADELGFAHGWTYDHLMWRALRDRPWYDAVPTLAAAAGATTRMGLGTMVASPSFRHPVPFAKSLMTLDAISGGRVVAGLGSGAGGFDEDALDGPGHHRALGPRDRARRFAEFVELTDRLLRSPRTDWSGEYFAAHEVSTVPGCVQRPRVPFAIAATGRRAMRLAARHGAFWVTHGEPGRFDDTRYDDAIPVLRKQVEALADACRAEGRDPADLRKLVLTGASVNGVLDSPEAFRDATGRLEEIGFTDMVVHWPRPEEPYAARPDALERISADLGGPA